VQWL
jgi:L-cystine uptake protein TcyP (sodium:dicarboxylate symporter family)